ncbi:MAG: GntR family transcriptional regulator [Thermoleophilia bacterium]|nr:GntR family transcriptional regulator [Thermoleophilia bacterium]
MAGLSETVGTNAERVYDDLRAAIVSGEFPPGERLRTEALAERFGTSRTPVREALVLLEGDGLVEIEPRRGAVVRSFDPADLVDLYEVRAVLEARAASLAATRITEEQLLALEAVCDHTDRLAGKTQHTVDKLLAANEEFHRIVIDAAGSPRLSGALRTVAGIPRPFKTVFWKDAAERARSLAAHREIVASLRAGSAERAESAMRLHVLTARDYLVEVMRERI